MRFENLKPSLKSLMLGSVPDAEWEFCPTDRTWATWHRAVSGWESVSHFFHLARENVRCPIPLMPTLAWLTMTVGEVPLLPSAEEVVLSCPLVSDAMRPRIYQAYTAWLRECHVGLVLAQHGQAIKNPYLDLEHGVDWIFRRDGTETQIAVTHDGEGSAEHWQRRKDAKTDQSVVVLKASLAIEGVSLVKDSVIEAAILSMSSPSR